MDENKRISGRRQTTRRASDILHDRLTTEERKIFDNLMCGKFLAEDRRTNERRLGADRRTRDRDNPEPGGKVSNIGDCLEGQ